MKQISSQTWNIISQLYQPQSRLNRLVGGITQKISLLNKLKEEKNVAVVRELLPLAMERNQRLAYTAKEVIHQIIMNTGMQSLIGLDRYIRGICFTTLERFKHWEKIMPLDIDSVSVNDEKDVTWLGILSFHRNGYIREKAVRKLSTIESSQVIPFLLLRLNDWVKQIRKLALQAIQARLNSTHAYAFLSSIYLVNHLNEYLRADHTWVIEEVHQLLKHPENCIVLMEGLNSPDSAVRRFSLELSLQTVSLDKEQILEKALHHLDPMLRLTAARFISKVCHTEDQEKWLPILLRDRFMPVRREGFQIWYSQQSSLTLDDWKLGLFDAHRSIRELTRFYMKKQTEVDPSVLYREELEEGNGNQIVAVLSGLGETGVKSDALLITPYVTDQRIQVRKYAIRALSRLDFETYHELFVDSLSDPSIGVVKEATKALSKHNNHLFAYQLWNLFTELEHKRPDVQMKLLSLFSTLGKSGSLIHYIKATGFTKEPLVRHVAKEHLSRWLRGYNIRFYVTFRSEEKEKLKLELKQAKHALGEQLAREIDFVLR